MFAWICILISHICIKEKKKAILPVNIILSISRKVIVDNQRHLLDINSSGLRIKDTINNSSTLNS